jgi:hypothetical protein
MPGRSLTTAVPALVSCAVPSRWISVQYFAEASQKLTCPTVTLLEPATTAAVSVTTLPEATDPPDRIVIPPETTVNDVLVAEGPAQACDTPTQKSVTRAEDRRE